MPVGFLVGMTPGFWEWYFDGLCVVVFVVGFVRAKTGADVSISLLLLIHLLEPKVGDTKGSLLR
jgi:hypothetical protein